MERELPSKVALLITTLTEFCTVVEAPLLNTRKPAWTTGVVLDAMPCKKSSVSLSYENQVEFEQ